MEQHRRSRKSHPSAVEGLIEDVICGRYKRRDEVKEPVTISHVSWLRLRLAIFACQEKGSTLNAQDLPFLSRHVANYSDGDFCPLDCSFSRQET